MQAEEIVQAEMLTPETMETEGDETEEDEVDRRQREIWETHRSKVRLPPRSHLRRSTPGVTGMGGRYS